MYLQLVNALCLKLYFFSNIFIANVLNFRLAFYKVFLLTSLFFTPIILWDNVSFKAEAIFFLLTEYVVHLVLSLLLYFFEIRFPISLLFFCSIIQSVFSHLPRKN